MQCRASYHVTVVLDTGAARHIPVTSYNTGTKTVPVFSHTGTGVKLSPNNGVTAGETVVTQRYNLTQGRTPSLVLAYRCENDIMQIITGLA